MCISGPIRRRRKKVLIVGEHFTSSQDGGAPNKGMKKSTSAGTLATCVSAKSLQSVQHPNTCSTAALIESDDDSSSRSDDEASIYSEIIPPTSCPSHRTTPAWMCRPVHRRPSKIDAPEGTHLVVNRHTLRLRIANAITPGTDAGKAGAILLGAHANAEVIVNDDDLWKIFQEHIRNTGPKAIASSEHIRNALVRPKDFCTEKKFTYTYRGKAQAHM